MTDYDNQDNSKDAVIVNTPARNPRQADAPVAAVGGSMINYIIIAAVFLAVGLLLGLNLGGGDEGVTAQEVRTIVGDEVRAAMSSELAGIMEDALGDIELTSGGGIDEETLQALIADAVDNANNQRNLLVDDDPYMGPEDAPVVIVEFSDFLCSFCGRHYQQTLQPIMDTYDGYVRYVFRDFPGVGGQNAVEAGMAAECANDQGQFWEYHNLLFDQQDALFTSDADALRTVLINHAETLELEMDTFTTCLDTDQHLTDVMRDSNDGRQNGVSGTPGFFVNGIFVSGAQPYETFASLIDAELEAAGITPPGSDT